MFLATYESSGPVCCLCWGFVCWRCLWDSGVLGAAIASGVLHSSVSSSRAGDFCWSVGWDMEMLGCCWGSWAGSEEALDACRWVLPGAVVLVWPPLVEQQPPLDL